MTMAGATKGTVMELKSSRQHDHSQSPAYPPGQQGVASYRSYEDARQAVARLAEQDFSRRPGVDSGPRPELRGAGHRPAGLLGLWAGGHGQWRRDRGPLRARRRVVQLGGPAGLSLRAGLIWPAPGRDPGFPVRPHLAGRRGASPPSDGWRPITSTSSPTTRSRRGPAELSAQTPRFPFSEKSP